MQGFQRPLPGQLTQLALTTKSNTGENSYDAYMCGDAGTYSLIYRCNFAWNTFAGFNPQDQVIGLDPRITAFIPSVENGPFGPAGNGGNSAGSLGRRLLRVMSRRLLGQTAHER